MAAQDSQVKLPEGATQDSQVKLPDELWSQILSKLSSKDLFSVSMTSKDLHRISKKPLRNLSARSNYKYRLRIEKDIEKRTSEKLKLKEQKNGRRTLRGQATGRCCRRQGEAQGGQGSSTEKFVPDQLNLDLELSMMLHPLNVTD